MESTAKTPMSALDAIFQRYSVRNFRPDAIASATVQKLLDAAVQAPTAMHREPWSFVVVQDAALLQQLSDQAKQVFLQDALRNHLDSGGRTVDHFRSQDFNLFYNAGTLIVICGRAAEPFVPADCWLAAENLMLAAHAMGLGSCVIGSAVAGINIPETKARLGIPADLSAIAPIIVGVPAVEGVPAPRKAPHVLKWA